MSMASRLKRLLARLRMPLPARERGIALILVLGTVAVLTVSIVQFIYDTRVNLHLAQNQRDEVKALCALMSRRVQSLRVSLDADDRAINEACDGVQFTISELARMIERYEGVRSVLVS